MSEQEIPGRTDEEDAQRPVEDFKDINLDVLRERTASMNPGRHELTEPDGPQQVVLPPEPERSPAVVIEAVDEHGGMKAAWQVASGGKWSRFDNVAAKQLDTWAAVVATAIGNGWSLNICRR